MLSRLPRAAFAALCALATLTPAFPSLAAEPAARPPGERAVLTDGRHLLTVARHEVDGGWLLELEGGGLVSVPLSLVDRFEIHEFLEIRGGVPGDSDEAGAALPGGAAEPAGEEDPDEAAAMNGASGESQAESLASLVRRISDEFDVDAALVESVVWVESGFDPFAVSPKGAAGLMQLMPATAKRFDVEDVFDPTENIRGGVQYLKVLSDRFDGDLGLVLASYNAGEGAVQRYGGVPPYRETQRYVIKVLERYLDATGPAGGAGPGVSAP